MNSKYIHIFLLTAFSLLALPACKDKWEEHNELQDPALSGNLQSKISASSELSKFSQYLAATGYDKVLASSKTFTVWAPTNQALESLDQSIANDPEKLKQFVANHIAYQEYFTHSIQADLRLKTLSGKYIALNKSDVSVEGIKVEKANQYARNGVLHVINGLLVPKISIWEFFEASPASAAQRAFMQSLSQLVRVDSLATQIGVDPQTGVPIYESNTGMVLTNRFLHEVQDVKSEDNLYTFIMLTDEAFEAEKAKLAGFYKDTIPERAAYNTAWNVVKDLAFKGLYIPENLPDTLVSASNVKVPIDKEAIVEVHRVSNGIVYVMNKCNFRLQDKIKPIVVEGEFPTAFSHSRPANTFYRIRKVASKQQDILVRGHAVAGFYIQYAISNVPVAKYKLYWVANNDFNFASLKQKLVVNTPTATALKTANVDINNLNEIYLGEYTTTNFGLLNLFVAGDAQNPIILDYIKLVPVL